MIGSGISGAGASWELSKAGINHIILESRDRIGGRIAEAAFEANMVPLGAAFVHNIDQNNRIAQLVSQWGFSTIQVDDNSAQYLVYGEGEASDTKLQLA